MVNHHRTTRSPLLGMGIIAMLALGVGCESGPRPTQQPETPLVGKPPADEPAPGSPKTQAPVEAEPPPVEEDARVELVMLEKGNPYQTETGIRVELEQTAPIKLLLSGPEAKEMISLPKGATYGEGTAFGSTWSITTEGGLHLELHHDAKPPLTEAAAEELGIRELDAILGCEGTLEKRPGPQGTLTFVRLDAEGATACSVVVGLHTRRVVTL